jgi:hypothetical protein
MLTLADVLPLIRKISPIAQRHGFSLALYGGVLNRGQSEQDLDLFFIEQDPDIISVHGCLDEIARLPEFHHCGGRVEGTGGLLCPIFLNDRKEYIDAQFRLLNRPDIVTLG